MKNAKVYTMKNYEYYLEAKKTLREELGERFPKSRDELTFKFLTRFGGCFEGVNEDDYEDDFGAYEDAYYSSDRWNYYEKLNTAFVELQVCGDEDTWNKYLDFFVDTFFPEWKD